MAEIFDILLDVRIATLVRSSAVALLFFVFPSGPQSPQSTPPSSAPAQSPATPPGNAPGAHVALGIVVIDPAHGGTDPGARGGAGLRECDVVLALAGELKTALEKQGFQIVLTRQGNDNPSFDDRSTLANAQRGAIFISLHVGSTGLLGTARVYTSAELPGGAASPGGFLTWDRAQNAFLPSSRKLADLVQGELAQRFKGSPDSSQTAAIRQLRTVAAPAIVVELSSVSIEDRTQLDRMLPDAAEAVARAVVAFKTAYNSSLQPGGAL